VLSALLYSSPPHPLSCSLLFSLHSPLFQNMSNLAVRDMFIVVLVLLFVMIHCTVTQQKTVLLGQAAMLLLSLLLLLGPQGELMDPDTMKAGAFGTFLFMVACLVGAM
jgi:hypothetical protein